MDPATVIALCKENIQPLRHGRNATQLGTALRAQEDSEVQQMLMQEKQMYEDAIKTYDGDDPLENWYEYISWMEQSFPKSGHESHIGKTLQQCLAAFEKDPKYSQDQRYIRLWINYISMQKNPLELYQLLYNNGIGTMVADMYRAWAFELEQIEDYKRADEVYLMGISALAEPREELDFAHKNFQLAIARRMLGHNEERSDVLITEQRQAFSSLRAIKAGRRVASVRTGHRVRDYLPGTVSQVGSTNNAARSSAKIQIYQDDTMGGQAKGASILDHVPIEETVHKENTIKPGPWSNSSKKCPIMTTNVKASFTVHEDRSEENCDMENVRLFPNHTPFFDGSKYSEHAMIPVYVSGSAVPGFTLAAHYPKDLVYANNNDRSMEEIRAERFLQRYAKSVENTNGMDELLSTSVEAKPSGDMAGHHLREAELQENERREKRKFQQEEMAQHEEQERQLEQQRIEAEQYELQRQRLHAEQQQVIQRQRFEEEKLKLAKERREAEQRELERREAEQRELERREAEQRELERRKAEQRELERRRIEQRELERQRREAVLEQQRYEAKQLKALEAVRIEAERIEAERIEAQRMEAELRNSQRKLQTSSFLLHRHHTSSGSVEPEEQHLLGQSLTVNTKEAMSVVQDLWHSPSETNRSLLINRPTMAERIPDTRTKLSFDIHMDSSMTQQHAMSTTKDVHPNNSYHMKSYHDQENHQHYHNSYSNQESQNYVAHAMPDSYHYQVPEHHEHRVHHHHHQQQQHPGQQHMQSPHQQNQMHHSVTHSQAQQHHHSLHGQQSHGGPHQGQIHHSPHSHQVHHHQSPHSQQQQHQAHHLRQPQHHLHHSPHSQVQHQHASPHIQQQQQQQQQQHLYAVAASAGQMTVYHQSYSMGLQCGSPQQQNVEAEKHLHFTPYIEPNGDVNKPYRMPEQLPYIKSPGMNRRDLKYLEKAENKENTSGGMAEYNNAIEGHLAKHAENNLYVDESLGTAPLSSGNDTCFTEAFSTALPSSTPLTNQFRQIYRPKDVPPQFSMQNHHELMPQQGSSDVTSGEADDKLSVIMESTREYVSSSSGSAANTRTTGFSSAREELLPIEEQQIAKREAENNGSPLAANKTYEEQMRAKIQAVHAQSPRTVQRNVDQITSEIKNNCDLRIPFKLKSELTNEAKVDSMDCEYQEPMEEAEEEEFVLPTGDINPFDKGLIAGLLRKIKFPQKQHSDGYVRLNINLNKIVPSSMITLGTEAYDVEKCLGKGTYGTVVKAIDIQSRQTVALKTQKPAWVWEYYIAREIKTRLSNPHMLRGFMDITKAYVADNGSVLVSQFSKYGTLLAVTNQVKIATGKPLVEGLAIFFTIEMLQIVEYLHKCQIIHGDIKPDNFLLMHLPTEDVRPTIQLIDFGCSIDMRLLPEDTKFKQIIKTQDFTCIEMLTGRPWTYQTDLYCLAGSSHCLLFGNYMRVSNTGGRWFINSKLPRYAKKAAWETYFTELLNVESCDKMPDLSKLRNMMEESLGQMPELSGKIRNFANVLNKR